MTLRNIPPEPVEELVADSLVRKALMTVIIKKIIAREGLVILGIIVIGFMLFLCGGHVKNRLSADAYLTAKQAVINKLVGDKDLPTFSDLETRELDGLSKEHLKTIDVRYRIDEFIIFISSIVEIIGGLLLVVGYPFYLLIRFIIWSVKTLKER